MSSNADTLPIVPGVVAGAAAWVFGYAITFLIAGTRLEESALNQIVQAFEGESVTGELVGWVFFNAHFVDTVLDVQVGIFGGMDVVSFIGGDDGFTPVLYFVPVALLIAAGLTVARIRASTETKDGAVGGLLVVPPYRILCVVGALLFRVSVGDSSGAPSLVFAVFLAGLVYPAVFGAIGGIVGAATAEETRGTP